MKKRFDIPHTYAIFDAPEPVRPTCRPSAILLAGVVLAIVAVVWLGWPR